MSSVETRILAGWGGVAAFAVPVVASVAASQLNFHIAEPSAGYLNESAYVVGGALGFVSNVVPALWRKSNPVAMAMSALATIVTPAAVAGFVVAVTTGDALLSMYAAIVGGVTGAMVREHAS